MEQIRVKASREKRGISELKERRAVLRETRKS